MVGWFGGGRLVASTAVLFSPEVMSAFAPDVHFRSSGFSAGRAATSLQKIIFPHVIRRLLASMKCFHLAGIAVARERVASPVA